MSGTLTASQRALRADAERRILIHIPFGQLQAEPIEAIARRVGTSIDRVRRHLNRLVGSGSVQRSRVVVDSMMERAGVAPGFMRRRLVYWRAGAGEARQ
jgi:predicted ArsR family transcriptional regulator